MLSGSIWGINIKAEEAKTYTDSNIRYLRDEQKQDIQEIQEDIQVLQRDVGEMKKDTAVTRAIIEERFGKK